MPEKVTSLNGLKVTLEYGSYTIGAHNNDYVNQLNKTNKFSVLRKHHRLLHSCNQSWELKEQGPFLSL